MGRKKCMICKEWITDNIVEAITGGKSMHFCSEECRDKAVKEQAEKEKKAADKDKVYRLICEIFGVSEIINTALWAEHKEWSKVASDEKIAGFLDENKDEYTRLIARLSSTEYAKIRYLSTILKNSLRDFKPKVEEKATKIKIDQIFYTAPTVVNEKKNALSDLLGD